MCVIGLSEIFGTIGFIESVTSTEKVHPGSDLSDEIEICFAGGWRWWTTRPLVQFFLQYTLAKIPEAATGGHIKGTRVLSIRPRLIKVKTNKTAQAGAAAEAAQYATGLLDHNDGSQSNDFAIVFLIVTALYSKIHPEYASYIYLLAPISLAFLSPIGNILCEISKTKANVAAENEPVESAYGRWLSIPPCSQMADSANSNRIKNRILLKRKVIVVIKIIESVFFNQVLLMIVLGVIGGRIFQNS